jgi:hypothetical protein
MFDCDEPELGVCVVASFSGVTFLRDAWARLFRRGSPCDAAGFARNRQDSRWSRTISKFHYADPRVENSKILPARDRENGDRPASESEGPHDPGQKMRWCEPTSEHRNQAGLVEHPSRSNCDGPHESPHEYRHSFAQQLSAWRANLGSLNEESRRVRIRVSPMLTATSATRVCIAVPRAPSIVERKTGRQRGNGCGDRYFNLDPTEE